MTRGSDPVYPIHGTIISGGAAYPDSYSLPQRIEMIRHAITANELAGFLAVSPITVYKMAKAGRLPSFRVGTAVRFDPRAIAEWLRGNMN
jgi:excisionase family DNA binding protein